MLAIINWSVENLSLILFYIIIFLLFYIGYKKKKVEIQNLGKFPLIFLYRTKFGKKIIDRIAKKHKEWVLLFGYVCIGIAFIGMIAIIMIIFYSIYTIIRTPQPVMSPVLPGITIPGVGKLSFWYWIIVIFIVALVHEFAHGIVARAHGLKIKSTGFGMLAIFPLAFVEPDEKALAKKPDYVKYSILGAGPVINIILAILCLIVLSVVLYPIQFSVFVKPSGVEVVSVEVNSSAQIAGFKPGMIIEKVDGKEIKDTDSFIYTVLTFKENEKHRFSVRTTEKENSKTKTLIVTTKKDPNTGRVKLGITLKQHYALKESIKTKNLYLVFYKVLGWIIGLIRWLYMISLAVGLFNLLPIGPLDGGRMLREFLIKLKAKNGEQTFIRISNILVSIILLLFIASLYLMIFK